MVQRAHVVRAHARHVLAHSQTPFADLVFWGFFGGEIDYFAAQHHVNGAILHPGQLGSSTSTKDKCWCLWQFYCHPQASVFVKILYYVRHLTFGSNLSHGSTSALKRVMVAGLNWYCSSTNLLLMSPLNIKSRQSKLPHTERCSTRASVDAMRSKRWHFDQVELV